MEAEAASQTALQDGNGVKAETKLGAAAFHAVSTQHCGETRCTESALLYYLDSSVESPSAWGALRHWPNDTGPVAKQQQKKGFFM